MHCNSTDGLLHQRKTTKMYIHPAIYDMSELMKENMHIHTCFSRCASPDMTVEAIVRNAEKAGLERIAIVDHYNYDIDDDIYLQHVHDMRRQLAMLSTDVKVLIGCELSGFGIGKRLGGKGLLSELDYRLYACIHYHVANWEHPQDKSPKGYARHIIDVAESVMETGDADCIAHPFSLGYIHVGVDLNQIAYEVTDEMLRELLQTSIETRTALELNNPFNDPYGLNKRMFAMGKSMGAVFNYGTDAHRRENIATMHKLDDVRKVCV